MQVKMCRNMQEKKRTITEKPGEKECKAMAKGMRQKVVSWCERSGDRWEAGWRASTTAKE